MPVAYSSSRTEVVACLAHAVEWLEQQRELDALLPSTLFTFAAAARKLAELRDRYAEPFRLAFVGEFKAGKSALINALLDRPGLVPEGATPTTGAVTELWWSATEGGSVFGGDGACVFRGSIGDAAKFADQRTLEGRSVTGQRIRVDLRVPCDFLRNLVVIDTPGLGASATDDRTTLDSLELADAAILVLNGLAPGGEGSLQLSEQLRTTRRKLLTVITRSDLISVPEHAVDAARQLFGAYTEGEPILVASPAIARAHAALREANLRDAATARAAAEQQLHDSGYAVIVDRLQDRLVTGKAAAERGARTLADVIRTLERLARQAAEQVRRSEEEIASIAGELDEVERRITQVLYPKRHFLGVKIHEIVDKHVGELIADLANAVDIYIDQLYSGGVALGLESFLAAFSRADQIRLRQRLQDKFRELFPDDQIMIMKYQIEQAVRRLMELEWTEIAAATAPSPAGFDPTTLVSEICGNLEVLTGTLAAEVLAWIGLLLVPGGILVDAALVFLSFSTGRTIRKSTPAKQALNKRTANQRIRSMRRQLTDQLYRHFERVNEDTAGALIARARQGSSDKHRARDAQRALFARWDTTRTALGRLIDECDDLAKAAP